LSGMAKKKAGKRREEKGRGENDVGKRFKTERKDTSLVAKRKKPKVRRVGWGENKKQPLGTSQLRVRNPFGGKKELGTG